MKNLGYHPVTDFTPISLIAYAPSFIAVRAGLPVNTLKEFVDHAKRNPGKLSFGSNGVGSYFHITGETFRNAAGIDMPICCMSPAPEAMFRSRSPIS